MDQPFADSPPLPAAGIQQPGPTRTSGLAVASLVLGILSCPLSFLAGIPGLVCGIMGLNGISRSERTAASPRLTGQGMAIAGVILSGFSMLLIPVMVGLTLPAVQAAREAARRVACTNNLKQMALSMLIHEDAMQILPAAITDADGRPLLSWRVAILPYVEEKALYDDFHLDEPWDSEHNRSLIPRMPTVYACPSAPPLAAGMTRYLLLDGPGAGFERDKQRQGEGAAARIRGIRMKDLVQGASNTILIVEAPADRAVEWTKPEELTLSPADAARLEDRSGGHAGGIRHAASADGHVEPLLPTGR